MAMTAYTGLQGHGKSYEVVCNVIVPQFGKGRRIVTNVAGLNVDLIAAYCADKLGLDPAGFGEIVSVSNEDVTKPNFYPKEKQDNTNCIVQPGDLVVLDEVWRWYVSGEKIPVGHLEFYRMHRHFLHPTTGKTCDVVFIVQVLDDLQRKISGTIEKSFLMEQHVDMGRRDRYVVSIYSGKRQSRFTFLDSQQKTYNPEIFPLYKSHSQGSDSAPQANEERADSRGNVLNRKIIKYGLPFAAVMILGASFFVYRFFHPKQVEAKPADTASAPAGVPPAAPAPIAPVLPVSRPKEDVSDRWRLVGRVMSQGVMTFVLADGEGRSRYLVQPPNYKASDLELEVLLPNGDAVTRWSGEDKKK